MRFPEFEGEWEEAPLSKYLEFKNGLNSDSKKFGKGMKFISVMDILNNQYITYDSIIGLVTVDIEIQKRYEVNYGDILFQRSSETIEDIGRANVYLDNKPAIFGGFVIRGKKIGNYYPIFLKYLLSSPTARKKVIVKGAGSQHYNIGQEGLSSILLHFPPLQEQNKIATFLSLLDSHIEIQSKIIEKYESLIKGISESLFSQKLGFVGFKQSWEMKHGNEVFANISDKNHTLNLPILAITQEHGAIPRNLIDYKVAVTDKSVECYKVVQIGDFVISLRSFQGGIEYSNYKGICSPAYIVLRSIIPINNTFYKYYLKTSNYIAELNRNLEGIRDGKMISYKQFSEIRLPYPTISEQNKIGKCLSVINKKLETEKLLLKRYGEQKKYLLSNLFM